MTFQDFTKAINEKRQDIKTVIKLTNGVYIEYINGRRGYTYTGNYCEILNKLKINAIYKRDLEQLQYSLQKDIDLLNNPNKWDSIYWSFDEALPSLKDDIIQKQDKINYYINNFILCDG